MNIEDYLLQVKVQLKDEMSQEIAKGKESLEKMNKELLDSVTAANKATKAQEKSARRIKDAWEDVATKSKYMFLTLGAGAAFSIKKYADVEYSIKKVQTISSASMDQLKKDAIDLSLKYGVSATEILNGNYDLVSSMGDVKEANEIMDTAIKLSVGGFTTYTGALNGLIAVMNGYNMKSSESVEVANKLIAIQNNGIITVNELQSTLARVAPTASAAGLGFNQLGAAIATITSKKLSPEETMTVINGLLTQTNMSSSQLNKTFKEISGSTFKEFINRGGDLVDGLSQIQDYATRTNKSLSDILTDQSATKAAIFLTSNTDLFKNNLNKISNSNNLLEKNYLKVSESTKQQLEKLIAAFDTATIQLGEGLNPKIKELTEYLNQVNWKETFSKENIDKILKTAKNIGVLSASLMSVSISLKAIAAFGTHPIIGALFLGGAAITTARSLRYGEEKPRGLKGRRHLLGIKRKGNGISIPLSEEPKNSKKEEEEVKKTTNNILTIVEEYQKKLNDFSLKGIELPGIKFETLNKQRELLVNLIGDLRKNNGEESLIVAKEEELKNLNKEIDILSDKLKVLKKIDEVKIKFDLDQKTFNLKGELFNLSNLEKAQGQVDLLQGKIDSLLLAGAGKEILKPLSNELKVAKEKVKEIKKEVSLQNLKTEFQKNLTNLNIKLEIFGANEQERLKETINFLSSEINKAIINGNIKKAKVLGKQLNLIQSNYDNKFVTPKAKEQLRETAISNFNNGISNMGNSINNIADLVDNDFSHSLNTIINGISTFSSSLQTFGYKDGIGGLLGVGKEGGLLANAAKGTGFLSNFISKETATSLSAGASAALPWVAGATAAVQIFKGIEGKSDAKRRKKNQENMRMYQENTSALKELGNKLRQNTNTIADFSMSLISSISKSPTLHRISSGGKVLNTMDNVMMENKNFGQLGFLVRESKDNWRGKTKHHNKYRTMSESELKKLIGFKDDISIKNMDLNKLKDFRGHLDELISPIQRDGIMGRFFGPTNKLRRWANSLTSRSVDSIDTSSFKEYEKNIDEFIFQIETLRKEQKELFKNSTLEAFEGVNVVDQKQLVKQYSEMFNSMGIDAKKYHGTIEDMAKSNQVLITSMEDVRNSFVDSLLKGNGSFANSLGGYFQKLLKNSAMIVYDSMYSEADSYFTKLFKTTSEKLLKMKETNKVNFKGFWDDFDFKKIIETDKIKNNFNLLVDDLRERLKESGISSSIIDSMLPQTELSEKISSIGSMLSSAMNNGLSNNDFNSFEQSLGESIYTSTKESLLKAFGESHIYKSLINKYFDTKSIEEQLRTFTDPKHAFRFLKDSMNSIQEKLEANGLGFNLKKPDKDNHKNLGNAYYQEAKKTITINNTVNFYKEVYGISDLTSLINNSIEKCLREVTTNPKILAN
ncbi:phage tail tape measure protein [Cetobacterium ceti]